jgi:hypothetical protein
MPRLEGTMALLTEKSLVRAEERRWLGDASSGRASRGRNQLTWRNDESAALAVRRVGTKQFT